MLVDSDGIEVCKYLKSKEEFKDIPVIVLTARSEESDEVLGLESGADDYVTKPFSPRELAARVEVVLKRIVSSVPKTLRVGGIILIDSGGYKVLVNDKEVNLATTEFEILKKLAQKKGWVFTRGKLLKRVRIAV